MSICIEQREGTLDVWSSYLVLKRPAWSESWFDSGYLSVKPLESPIEAYKRQNELESGESIALVPQAECGIFY